MHNQGTETVGRRKVRWIREVHMDVSIYSCCVLAGSPPNLSDFCNSARERPTLSVMKF